MTDRYEKIRATLAHEIWAAAQLAPGEGIVDGVDRIVALLRKVPHPAITHCDNCGCDWLDNGLNPVGCPYCKVRRETERDLKEWIERDVEELEALRAPIILRKQAEAVEQCWTDIADMALSPDVLTPEVAFFKAARYCADYSLRLRKQSEAAGRAGR